MDNGIVFYGLLAAVAVAATLDGLRWENAMLADSLRAWHKAHSVDYAKLKDAIDGLETAVGEVIFAAVDTDEETTS